MYKTTLIRTLIGLLAAAPLAWAAPQSQGTPPAAPQYRALLDRYCVTCHNERLKTASLMLDKMDVASPGDGAETWEKVVLKLRAGQMPPARAPRPDAAAYKSFVAYLEGELDRAAAAHPNPGQIGIRRLNRAEYTNAVRDLLAIDIDGDSLLPADDSRYGFDNNGAVLTISPLLLERYMSAARRIGRLAVGDTSIPPAFESYEVSKYYRQDDRASEDLPFGSRGGIAVRHYFPLDGEYVVKVRFQRNSREYIRGLGDPHQMDVRLDGARVKLFTVGGERLGKSAGIFSSASLGDPKQETYERTADDPLEIRFAATAGPHRVEVSFLKETAFAEGPLQPHMSQYDFTQYKGGEPAVASVAIGGPFDVKGVGDTASRERIFTCHPSSAQEQEPCARRILARLARQAYRRSPTDAEIDILLGFYRTGSKTGGFEAGIRGAVERILMGPEFLFRVESDPPNLAPGAVHRVSDIDVASRLSFFLWSSIPDEELLSLAEKGRLSDPAVLEQQVRRMLADARSKALVENFAGQWLYLRNLRSMTVDPEAFPYFDENLREAFQTETEMFFESMLREDHSVLDLLTANYTFVNERLAKHYGIPDVYGSHFRRVTLNDPNRAGLLGQGSILTVTSHANRTSPVVRGKWVLDSLLGAPPPPPPPNVPQLREPGEDGRSLSMRQRMEEHRANPVCASCHKMMDPIGFSLENFDAIGKWRIKDSGMAIDTTGELPDGTPLDGPASLRKALASKQEEFVSTVAERLLTYALGRGAEYYDEPAIRKIVHDAAPGGYRWSQLFLGVVKSIPFQMRRSPQP
jgi:mono/diheme cytochrome c family protein